MARPASTKTIPLPSTSDFLKTLDGCADQCAALLSVKGPTRNIIPANIRRYMQVLPRLNEFWLKNRAAYTALVEAAEAGTPKTQRAGA